MIYNPMLKVAGKHVCHSCVLTHLIVKRFSLNSEGVQRLFQTRKMPPKKRAPKGMGKPLPPGQIITDLRKTQWKLGPLIGQGGFGYLYLGSDKVTSEVKNDAAYVIKVEPHSNGPLFVELAFYQRAAKQETISAWMRTHKQSHLGVPRFIGSGSFENGGTKYRFMIMDRFGEDVEKKFLAAGRTFPIQTVFGLALRIVEVLEYLHEQEYVHADVKASNLLVGFGKDSSKVYLVDYGLAYRYCPSGKHVAYKEDPKRKHDGTIEYTSRDAHKGLAPSRRGDLEVLAYCMLQWLCRELPWETNLTNKDFVMQEKTKFMKDIDRSLKACLGTDKVPGQLADFFKYVNKLEYTEKPDYDRIKKWFQDALKRAGFADDGKSVYFAPPLPGVKPKAASKNDKLVNGEAKKKRVAKTDDSTDEGPSPPKRQKQLKSSQSESTEEQTTPKKTAKRGKKLSNGKNVPKRGTGVRKTSVSPANSSPRKRVAPRSRTAAKNALTLAVIESGVIQETKRRTRKRKTVDKVDFAQSP